MDNSKGNFRKDYVTPIESFLVDFKPYHSKIAEVLTIYKHADNVNVSIAESWHFTIGVSFDKSVESQSLLCDGIGWSVDSYGDTPYDEPFLCADFPSTILYTTIDDSVTFDDGSVVQLNDNVDTAFNNEHTPFSGQLRLFSFDNVTVTTNVISADATSNEFILTDSEQSWRFISNITFVISGTGNNSIDGQWTVDYAYRDNATGLTPTTRIKVKETIPPNSESSFTLTFPSITMREYLNSIGQADDVYDWDGFGNNGFDAISDPTLTIYTSLLPSSDALDVTLVDGISGSLPTTIDSNSATGDTQAASFVETLIMAVTHLYLEENMSAGFDSDASSIPNFGTINHGTFIGSWDMNYWDIGSFDETEQVAILNGNL